PDRVAHRHVDDRLSQELRERDRIALRGERMPGWEDHAAPLAKQRTKLDAGVLELAVQDGDVSGAIAQPAERVEDVGEVDRQLDAGTCPLEALTRGRNYPPCKRRDVADDQRAAVGARSTRRRDCVLRAGQQRARPLEQRLAGWG